ncbi:DUF1963 domain-containing protein [Micromonospora sp. WMMA1976]|uniref:DUF1963 domain-containing protein n=1 Tax=Micromonospora sp. WMMA1976 TaxID=3014995 RepID=UPI00248B9FEC|nr:DUF1963 domain-containing protein [Micromonospora sp. WMMA1976]WBC05636.1 DUF1963 domain-containing protein [Micromonospora sp. WMMA1976]
MPKIEYGMPAAAGQIRPVSMMSVDHYGLLRRAATDAGFTETETATFAELLRFAIWTSQRYNGELAAHSRDLPPQRPADLLVGRAGGLPQLPVGMPWPTDPEGYPLPFIASFDCAALPRVERLPLPSDGSLLVFLHHEEDYDVCERSDEQQYGRLLYVRAGTETTAQLPADYAAHPYYADRDFIAPEQDLFAVVQAVLPSWLTAEDADLSVFQQQLARDMPHRRELCALVDRLWPAADFAAFQFGGYSWHTGGVSYGKLYDDPELEMAETKLRGRLTGIDRAQEAFLVEQELQRVRREWLPLVQFETRDYVYFGRFMIRVDDLAAQRFDRAVSWTEFTE